MGKMKRVDVSSIASSYPAATVQSSPRYLQDTGRRQAALMATQRNIGALPISIPTTNVRTPRRAGFNIDDSPEIVNVRQTIRRLNTELQNADRELDELQNNRPRRQAAIRGRAQLAANPYLFSGRGPLNQPTRRREGNNGPMDSIDT